MPSKLSCGPGKTRHLEEQEAGYVQGLRRGIPPDLSSVSGKAVAVMTLNVGSTTSGGSKIWDAEFVVEGVMPVAASATIEKLWTVNEETKSLKNARKRQHRLVLNYKS